MKLNIAVLPGDGIGPEIAAQGVEVMSAVCKKFGHEVRYEYALCGIRQLKCVLNRDCWLCVRNWACLRISGPYKLLSACCINHRFVLTWWMVRISCVSVN